MALVIGLTMHSVNQKCAGNVRWSLHEVVKISEWLGVPLGDLVAGEQRVTEHIAWRLDQEAQARRAADRVGAA